MAESSQCSFLQVVSGRLRTLRSAVDAPPVPWPENLDAEELRLRDTVNGLEEEMSGVRRFVEALSRGKLDLDPAFVGAQSRLAAVLKELHARLRELTWQAQQVAAGDYRQRIHFLGDFSEAFNSMVETLDERERSLRETVRDLDQTNRQLRESQDKLQHLFDAVADAVLVLDREGCVTECNQSVLPVLGYAKRELVGLESKRLFSDPGVLKRLLTTLSEGCARLERCVTVEAVLKRKNGETFDSLVTASSLVRADAAYPECLAVCRDITHIKAAEALLRRQATQDPLTGLFNRRQIMDLLDRSLHAARRHNQPLAVAMCDLNGFKTVNDTYGHPAGDYALKAFAHILKTCVRREDMVGRYGGDEFVVLFPNSTAEQARPALRRASERLRSKDMRLNAAGSAFRLSAAFGIAGLDRRHADADALLADADKAMYEAKKAKDGCIRLISPGSAGKGDAA